MTRKTLATVRPGPTLHVWQDGRELARVPLGMHGGLALLRALAAALEGRNAKTEDCKRDATIGPDVSGRLIMENAK